LFLSGGQFFVSVDAAEFGSEFVQAFGVVHCTPCG
jgi:hypothetical protein